MDSARSEQRALARAIPMFIEPARNLLGANGSTGPIAFTGQPKSQPNDVRLDGLNLNALLLFCSDNLDIEGSVPEWDDSAIEYPRRAFSFIVRVVARTFPGTDTR